MREQTATETMQWLADHDHDSVRTQFLAFIQKLPKEKQFDQLREKAATETMRWLARHEEVTSVRTQFLAFIQQLPAEFDELRKQTGFKTSEWSKAHPDNYDVRQGYVRFLLAVRVPDLAALEAESIPHHQWLIARTPAVGSHFVFGEQLLRLKKFAEAKVEFELVLAQEPQHQLAHRGLAIALQNLGKPKEAEDAFKLGLHLAKTKGGMLARFHTSLGLFYLSQNRWTEAIQSFEEASKESSEYYGNHWGIAKAQKELGGLREAKQSLERALADPGLCSPAKEEIEEMFADVLLQISASI